MPESFDSPDPSLTANIYCTGGLDLVIFRVVGPFLQDIRLHLPTGEVYLWAIRYGRGGEHVKVRVHSPEGRLPLLRKLLEERTSTFFTMLPALTEFTRKTHESKIPAIDVEDDVGQDHPDRSLLWTTYRRSHVLFGSGPFLENDRYVSLFTRCLASGCDLLLALKPSSDGLLPHRLRQSSLLKALIAGLGALGFSSAKRVAYLSYHRDWLFRFISPKNAGIEPRERLRQTFDERVNRMGETLRSLRVIAGEEWAGSGLGRKSLGPEIAWKNSLAALLEFLIPVSADPIYQIDPYACDPTFPSIFKVLHGLANQLGLKMADEALVHHILLRVDGDQEIEE